MKDENYIPKFLTQKKLSVEEMSLIKNTFKDNDALLKLLRKIFWPDFDWNAPLGQTQSGLWMGLDQMMQISPVDRELVILTQIRLNNLIEKGLMELSYLANQPEEKTPEEIEVGRKKDSAK